MTEAELREAVAGIEWWHSIDLGHGIVTPGKDDSPAKLRDLKLPARFDGRSVLDIGAWDGFFSFEAERRGAARVLATDSFAWEGVNVGSKHGFELARQALDSKVEDSTSIRRSSRRKRWAGPSTSSCSSGCSTTCATPWACSSASRA